MHLLGMRDVEVVFAGLETEEIVDVMSCFLHFMLIDKPTNLDDGHTFRTGEGARRFVMSHTRCESYESDSFNFNPYGHWRLAPKEPVQGPLS